MSAFECMLKKHLILYHACHSFCRCCFIFNAVNWQFCVQPRPSAVSMTLPAFAVAPLLLCGCFWSISPARSKPTTRHCCFAVYLVCSKLYSIVCLLLCRQDWWNSSTFANYYRTWNVVVHDWLYCYVYKECYLVCLVCLTTNEMHSVLPTYHFVVTLQYYTIKSCVRHIWSAESEAQAVVSGGRWQGGSKRKLVKNNMS